MALGAIELPSVSYAFDSEGTAIVPVTAGQGDKKLGTIEIKSPMEDVSEFFAGIDKSLINLVEFAKKSFNLDQKEEQRETIFNNYTPLHQLGQDILRTVHACEQYNDDI